MNIEKSCISVFNKRLCKVQNNTDYIMIRLLKSYDSLKTNRQVDRGRAEVVVDEVTELLLANNYN